MSSKKYCDLCNQEIQTTLSLLIGENKRKKHIVFDLCKKCFWELLEVAEETKNYYKKLL